MSMKIYSKINNMNNKEHVTKFENIDCHEQTYSQSV